MSSPYRQAHTGLPPQFHERQLAPFVSRHPDYRKLQNYVSNNQSIHKRRFGHNCAEALPASFYQTSKAGTPSLKSPSSSDLQSTTIMSEVGSPDDFIGFQCNIDETVHPSGTSEFLPRDKLSTMSGEAPLGPTAYFNSTMLLEPPNSSLTMHEFLEPMRSIRTPFVSTDFGSPNQIATWDQEVPSTGSHTSFGENAGTWTMLSNCGNTYTMNTDFNVNVDENPIYPNILGGGPPNQRPGFYNPALSRGIAMERGYEDISWTPVDATLTDAASLHHDEPAWNLENQVEDDDLSNSYQINPSIWNMQHQSHNPHPAAADYLFHQVELGPSVWFPRPRATKHLPVLKPKLTPPSPPPLEIPAGSNQNSVTSQRPRRKGPLDAEGRRGASQMRQNRACLRCRLRKTKCSGKRGETCRYCLSSKVQPRRRPAPCLRGPLPELENVFCPNFTFAHLEPAATQDWMKKSNWVAVGNEISIKASSGPFFDSMSFFVRKIWLPDPEFLLIPDISSETYDPMQGFASIASLPYALSDYNVEDVKLECERYINTISKCPLHLLEKIDGNTSPIVWQSLETVWRFFRVSLAARQNKLLECVIKLYWIIYAMGREITLTVDSSTPAVEDSYNEPLLHPTQSEWTSRFVTRQIQTAMAVMFKEVLRDVLEGLEAEYKSDTRISGAIAFCTNLILCLIVGELLAVFDGLTIYNIFKEGEDPVQANKRTIECARELEDVLTFYSWTVFFKNCQRYNPIKDESSNQDASGPDQGIAGLRDDLHRIMQDFEKHINDQAAENFGRSSRTILDHKKFNVGRLLCQYLKRFY